MSKASIFDIAFEDVHHGKNQGRTKDWQGSWKVICPDVSNNDEAHVSRRVWQYTAKLSTSILDDLEGLPTSLLESLDLSNKTCF